MPILLGELEVSVRLATIGEPRRAVKARRDGGGAGRSLLAR